MSGNKLTRLHVHADGLIVSKSDTDNQPVKLTLASAETEVTGGEVVGQIDFKSADDSVAGDGIVCASIKAEAQSAFNGTDDPTKLSFLTRNSGASAERMVITPQGVGIGTTDVATSVNLAIGDSDTGLKQEGVGQLALIANGNEGIRVTDNGVGIKTQPSGSDLDLAIGDSVTGLSGSAAGLALRTGNQERMRVTNNGVGIKTTSVAASVDLAIGDNDTGFRAHDETTDGVTNTFLAVNTNGQERMRVTNNGVGIRTTTVANNVDLAVGDSDTGLKQQGDGELALVQNGDERMRITTNGVGINTKVVHQTVDLAIGDSDTGFKTGTETGTDQQHLAVITNVNERMRVTNNGVGIRTTSVADTVDLAIGDSDTGLKQKGDGVLALMTDNLERMRVTNSGVMIGSENTPSEKLDVRGIIRVQNGISNADFFKAYTNDSTGRFFFRWGTLGGDSSTGNYNVHVIMLKNSNERSVGFFENDGDEGSFDFTGQHRSIMNTNYEDDVVGLIASATGQLINLDNGTRATINESLPYCILANSDNDKKVYGVISKKEDDGLQRVYGSGFVATMDKANNNEQRMYINAVGEGGIWVCNKNGAIENGDYVTSSSVVGYGMKQLLNEGLLTNYTVAKLTQDCEFTLTKVVKQKLKVIVGTDAQGNSTSSIDYDANGNVLYEDDLDSEGNQQMVYPLDTRFLLADGTQLVDEADYSARKANGEEVFIACFVGCTYHCG